MDIERLKREFLHMWHVVVPIQMVVFRPKIHSTKYQDTIDRQCRHTFVLQPCHITKYTQITKNSKRLQQFKMSILTFRVANSPMCRTLFCEHSMLCESTIQNRII